jgi:hypothetical protein
MRGSHMLWRRVLVLTSVFAATTFNGCTADFLRQMATNLNQLAYQLDGKPTTIGQWWDGLWNQPGSGDAQNAQKIDDLWNSLWH